MDLSNVFRLVNLGVGLVMVLGGIAHIVVREAFNSIILGVFVILFGLVNAGLEFQSPPYVARYASFYFSFLGRGLFYIFIGAILLSNNLPSELAGGVIGIIGVGYAVLEFVPQIEPPANMREADQGWGAEQV